MPLVAACKRAGTMERTPSANKRSRESAALSDRSMDSSGPQPYTFFGCC